MDQLRSRRVLRTATFTLFLKPTGRPDVFFGNLILGGVDPTKYVIPLRYVLLLSIDDYVVELRSLSIQAGETTLGINQRATIHTGDKYIGIPQPHFAVMAKQLASAASTIRGSVVDIKWDEEEEVYRMECSSRIFMPTLTFNLGPNGGVPLEISFKGYVRKYAGDRLCTVMITEVADDSWELSACALVGNYIEYQPIEMKLGIAKLKP
ncbi:hypothetical protein FOL47_002523 [Perkinsus chesapeaki]|uniref:Peptidase A1 domain-containing protein n=1 Tax=Perkinsus chesapeaki TaxID=330153 RepID=A0A7J6N0Z2_PERCH|nr:hypothetical protein FOL47_002523 [Perkinsus chesapeaki]